MNIGIITHHTVINQGAIMQMYALKRWLENKGHTVFLRLSFISPSPHKSNLTFGTLAIALIIVSQFLLASNLPAEMSTMSSISKPSSNRFWTLTGK